MEGLKTQLFRPRLARPQIMQSNSLTQSQRTLTKARTRRREQCEEGARALGKY